MAFKAYLTFFNISCMRTYLCCASTTTYSRAKIWYNLNEFKLPSGLGCSPFTGGGVVLLLIRCRLLLPLLDSVIGLCLAVRYFISILVLQSSWWGKGGWFLYLVCLPGVWWLLCGFSSRCHGVVCSLWLRYFLIRLIYYFEVAGVSWNLLAWFKTTYLKKTACYTSLYGLWSV